MLVSGVHEREQQSREDIGAGELEILLPNPLAASSCFGFSTKPPSFAQTKPPITICGASRRLDLYLVKLHSSAFYNPSQGLTILLALFR